MVFSLRARTRHLAADNELRLPVRTAALSALHREGPPEVMVSSKIPFILFGTTITILLQTLTFSQPTMTHILGLSICSLAQQGLTAVHPTTTTWQPTRSNPACCTLTNAYVEAKVSLSVWALAVLA
jgi:hypothetical protein